MNFLTPIESYLHSGESWVILIGAIFLRVSAIAFLAPGIGERAIPVRVRLAIAAAITIVLTPIVGISAFSKPETIAQLVLLFAAEAISGLLIGYTLRIFVFILQIAGSITAQHLSLSQLFGPNVGFESESPFSAILVMAGVTIAVSAGLHFYLLDALAQSYDILPLGIFPDGGAVGEWSVKRAGDALLKALALSSPFVILGFLYSLALAASSRAMPQLMAAFVGAPAITLAGLALFAVASPIILFEWLAAFEHALFDLFSGRL